MEVVKFHISNSSRFHFGDSKGRLNEIFSSDKLFSALINNIALVYGDEAAEEMVKYFIENKINLSSILYGLDFYFIKENRLIQTLYFFPKPLANIKPPKGEIDISQLKKMKKISYVSLKVLKELFRNWDKEKNEIRYDISQLISIGSKFLCHKSEVEGINIGENQFSNINIFAKKERQRVAVRLNTHESENTYSQEELEINYNYIGEYEIRPFMYMLIKGELNNRLKAGINLIADEGLGGKRSLGLGYFKDIEYIDKQRIADTSNKSNYFMTISSYYPKIEELQYILQYQLQKRDGFIYSKGRTGIEKEAVRVLQEGSIFTSDVEGDIIDITPKGFTKHRVYLYGKAFLLGFEDGDLDEI